MSLRSLIQVLAKAETLRIYLKVWEHPSAELKTEKQEIEHHEVKPQDAMLVPMNFSLGQRRALDSDLSLSQPPFKFPEDKTDKYVPLFQGHTLALNNPFYPAKKCEFF